MAETAVGSAARDAILAQHAQLRDRLARTLALVLEPESRSGCDGLRQEARVLYTHLAAHMTFEEALLATALSDVVGCGALLHAELEEDHARQRGALASAIAALGPTELSPAPLAESLIRFAEDLLTDMEREECFLLAADVDAMAGDSLGG
jgi:hypothetical protein